MDRDMQTDVAIVGAGLGGLYAAYRLLNSGLKCCVIEARSRVGGRILSLPSAAEGLDVDLGPTWYWPHQPRIQRLLDELGIESFDQYSAGEAIYELRSGQCQRAGTAMAMHSRRVQGGMQRIVDKLADRLGPGGLNLSHTVETIERTSTGWKIGCTENATAFDARHLILAMPPRLIAQTFGGTSWLPQALRGALARVPTWMAAQAKFVATYDTAFWRGQGLAGDAFSQVGPLVEIHDASASVDAGHALFGFIGIASDIRTGLPEGALETHCLNQFERIFGPAAGDARQCYLVDWARDPQITVEADLEQDPDHPQIDLIPFQSDLVSLNLGFAVTETATEEAGYLEGALQAAERAVNTV